MGSVALVFGVIGLGWFLQELMINIENSKMYNWVFREGGGNDLFI